MICVIISNTDSNSKNKNKTTAKDGYIQNKLKYMCEILKWYNQ